MTGGEVARGSVGGHLGQPPIPVERFLGEVVLLKGRLKRGDRVEMKCGTKRTRCRVQEIRERLSSETGEVMGQNAVEIGEQEAATIVFETEPLVVERFSEVPELGRFILAREGKNIGAGVVLAANL
ncbi:Elongation factor Tu [subsurface metagenome]